MLVPIARASGIGFDDQVTHFSGRNGLTVFVDDTCFKSRNDGAARARLHLARSIRDKHVQRFGGSDGIENFNSKTILEAMKDGRRKRFARGNSVADGGEVRNVFGFWRVSE